MPAVIALWVEVLDPIPLAVGVDIANDLPAHRSHGFSYELDRLAATLTGSAVARLDGPVDCTSDGLNQLDSLGHKEILRLEQADLIQASDAVCLIQQTGVNELAGHLPHRLRQALEPYLLAADVLYES